MTQWLVWVLIIGLLLVFVGGSGVPDGGGGVECVDGDYPSSATVGDVVSSIGDDWATGESATPLVMSDLRGYESVTATAVQSPVDGDVFHLSVFKYASEAEASTKGTFWYARDGPFVINIGSAGSENASLDGDGEKVAMFTSFECISAAEVH